MDEKQIAFITCVNDDAEYAECRYYLGRLHIPKGYCMDIISIQEAPSMAAGYNAAMKSSDAKYKIYLHQDVFIKNRSFISDLLSVFAEDERIGLMGMAGCRTPWADISSPMAWDTGKAVDSSKAYSFAFPKKTDKYAEVQAADGFLMATQYDLLWREDLFDGWHFYDLSQCMEFKKAGYTVAVPWQENAWCYHDDSYPRLGAYYDYLKIFMREYGDRADFPIRSRNVDLSVYNENREASQIQENLIETVEKLFCSEDRVRLRYFFEDLDIKELRCLWEYKTIVDIDRQEEEKQSILRFWTPGMSIQQLLLKMRTLKHALKRIEYGADKQEKSRILENYSMYAVINVCTRYAITLQ